MDIVEQGIAEMKPKLMALLSSQYRNFNTKYDDLKIRGVYVIYEGNDIIYIGESDDIQRRIFVDLLKGDDQAHTLRGKLYGYKGLDTDEDIDTFLKTKCKFQAIREIYRIRLEDFAIGVLKPRFNNIVGKSSRIRKIKINSFPIIPSTNHSN